MFKRKSRCQKTEEMLSAYLDGRLISAERDAVKYHLRTCNDCRRELDSLETTLDLLHRLPLIAAPRAFTLTGAQGKREWVPYRIPSVNRLRVATAAAMILLAVLVTGDFAGLFYAEISLEPERIAEVTITAEAGEVETLIPLKEEPSPVASPAIPTPPAREGSAAPKMVTVPETEEAVPPTPSPPSTEDTRIAGMAEDVLPGAEEAFPTTDPKLTPPTEDLEGSQRAAVVPETHEATPVTSPLIAPDLVEGELLLRKAYPWLRPLEIVFATLVIMLGSITFLVWQRRWGFSTVKRSSPHKGTKNYFK